MRSLLLLVAAIALTLALVPVIGIIAIPPAVHGNLEHRFDFWKLIEGTICAVVGWASLFAIRQRKWRALYVSGTIVFSALLGMGLALSLTELEFLRPFGGHYDLSGYQPLELFRLYSPYVYWMLAECVFVLISAALLNLSWPNWASDVRLRASDE